MIDAIEELKNSGKVIVDEDHDWGYQLRFVNEKEYCGKFLVLVNDIPGSFHSHRVKKETFIVLYGEVAVEGYVRKEWLGVGEMCTIEPGEYHMMMANVVPCIVLEVSTHDEDSDTYRIKD